jgi:ribosome-binding ATPase YchF (GTP1/OBG family)
MLADMVTIENRMTRLEKQIKVARKEHDETELGMLRRFYESLESEKPLHAMELSDDEAKLAAGFGFLTLKPMLYILNLGEDQVADRERWESDFKRLTEQPETGLASICGSLQMDIAALDEADRAEFLKEMGLTEPASDIIIKKSFDLLGMIVFLTGADADVHAWPIPSGTTAHDAAGAVHSDMKRGFIKAEVAAFDDLDKLGSWAKAREAGKLHLHGKDYVVQDGDVILFRFNV